MTISSPSVMMPSARFRPIRTSEMPPEATDALGVHVHFFRPGDGWPLVNELDLDQIRQAGFRKARLDILWSEVEKKPGVFDFRRYDWAIQGLLKRGIQPMIILGPDNPLYTTKSGGIQTFYDPAASYRSHPIQSEAFARYAVETVRHYRGHSLIYELINEPNQASSWNPEPDVNAYMRMAWRILPALKACDPTARLVAPSTAGAPPDFLESRFRQGLLTLVDGVTIHPYQAFYKTFPANRNPERFEKELHRSASD